MDLADMIVLVVAAVRRAAVRVRTGRNPEPIRRSHGVPPDPFFGWPESADHISRVDFLALTVSVELPASSRIAIQTGGARS